jgi:hypothetical protein
MLDPDRGRIVGSTRGIVHQNLAREDSRIWPQKLRSREGVRSRVSASRTSGVEVEVIQPRKK